MTCRGDGTSGAVARLERKEAIGKAPKRVESNGAARSVGDSHSLRKQRSPRPVQTGGGRSETLSSTQLVALVRLLLIG